MKKKTVAVIIFVIVALITGGCLMLNHLFSMAESIKCPDVANIDDVSISMHDGAEIEISDTTLAELISLIKDAEPTRKMSVNDYPGVKPYYVVVLKASEREYRYMLYKENGTGYIEIPYEGIYTIGDSVFDLLK